MADIKKFNIRELSRETKKVLKNLPCFITYNRRVIAQIINVDIPNGVPVQDLHAPAAGGHREPVSPDEKGELPSLSN